MSSFFTLLINCIIMRYSFSFIKHVLILVYNIMNTDHLLDQLTISLIGRVVPKSVKTALAVNIGLGGGILENANSYQERVLLRKPPMQYLVRRAAEVIQGTWCTLKTTKET